MLKWYDNLYVDKLIKNKKEDIVERINEGKVSPRIYCIILASNGNNLFDILNANELLFDYYKKREIFILGLAIGRNSAIELAVDMLEEVYKNTGDFKVREYYKFNLIR